MTCLSLLMRKILSSKQCFKCGEKKPLSAFYKHNKMADGHLGKCKECTKSDTIKNRAAKVEYYREYDRKRGSRQGYDYFKNYRAENPEKYAARTAVGNAVRDKRLIKKPCERCGAENVHGHHEDYSKPLDVIWLCPPCHKQRHKEIKKCKAHTADS